MKRLEFICELLRWTQQHGITNLYLWQTFCQSAVSCSTLQLCVLQVAYLWKGISLKALGNTPNILSGQPLSPKSSKNKRRRGETGV
jgi:hypothetical protein